MRDGWECFAPDFDKETAGFLGEDFETLSRVESGSFWFRARNELILWAAKRFFPDARSFMEVGCGTGFVLGAFEEHMPQLSLTGSELFPEGLRCVRSRLSGRVRLLQMDARAIPFENEFDIVGAFDVLEHISQDEEVLCQMFRAVKAGGIIVTVPQHPWLWSDRDTIAKHERRYVSTELLGKLRKAGFQVVMSTSFASLVMPLMFLSRFGKMDAKKAYGELVMPRWIDRILNCIMAVERGLIKWGMRLPLGGSFLIVGAKVHD